MEKPMGLDAVVYKNLSRMDADVRRLGVLVDERTGEVYLEQPVEGQDLPLSAVTAVDRRLGNVESVSRLREEVVHALGIGSILETKFLYSGTHSGDLVGLEFLSKLQTEVGLLKSRTEGQRSSELTRFLDDVSDLIRAARAENNPIVFV